MGIIETIAFVLVLWFFTTLDNKPKSNPTKKAPKPRVTEPIIPYTAAWERPVKSADYIDYKEYVTSDAWQKSERRLNCIKAARNKCQMCGAMFGLEVHHITYTNLGKELPQDLVLLCISCHEYTHAMAGKGAKSYPPLKRP